MNTEVTANQTTALTVQQRATLALGLSDIEATLIELAAQSKSITAISNPDGYTQCHSARMALVRQRLDITKRGKTAREDAQAFSKAVITEEAKLVALIQPEEKRLQKIQDDHDAAVETKKQAKIEAELKRVADLRERVTVLRGNRTLCASSGITLIADHINDLESLVVDESFQEFEAEAADAKRAGLSFLREIHAAAIEQEAEKARIKAEREELAKLRAEAQVREKAERERIAEEERQAKAARDAETARQAEELRLQREAIAEEQRKARELRETENRQRDETLRQERERIAEESRIAQESQAAEQAHLDEQRRRLEADQAAARKAAEPSAPLTRRGVAVKMPTGQEIIQVLAAHYKATPDTVIDWLANLDFSKVA